MAISRIDGVDRETLSPKKYVGPRGGIAAGVHEVICRED